MLLINNQNNNRMSSSSNSGACCSSSTTSPCSPSSSNSLRNAVQLMNINANSNDKDDLITLICEEEFINKNSEANEEQDDETDAETELLYYQVRRDSGNSSKCSLNEYNNSYQHSSTKIIIDTNITTNYVNLNNNNFTYDEDYIENTTNKTDLNLLSNDRTLNSLLCLEDNYRLTSNYFLFIQNDIKPWMRKMLASWMLEVCKNQDKDEEVFVLSMNLLDRFLAIQTIGKRHLQLLGTVCMFIASKLKSSSQFNAETLVIYTANSITIEELLVS
jgi:hypothetical protein